MGLVISLVSLGRAARNKVQIKVRQPLSAIMVSRQQQPVLSPVAELVKEELNIKELQYIDNPDEYVSYTVKPNFPVLGPKYGKLLQGIAAALSQTSAASLVKDLRENGAIQLDVAGNPVTLTNEDLEVRVQDKEGFAVEMAHGHYVVLNIGLTPELIEEGIAREIVSKVQNTRKNLGFELTDRIKSEYRCYDVVTNTSVTRFQDYIKNETLSVAIEGYVKDVGTFDGTFKPEEGFERWDINGHPVDLRISKL
jgi:isoleucyl-tRNA synthetase